MKKQTKASKSREVEFWNTKASKTLSAENLVWAQLEVYDRALFPAMIVSSAEYSGDDSVDVPAPGEIVVEFIRQPKLVSSYRFLVVKRKLCRAYNDVEGTTYWHPQLCGKMLTALRGKHAYDESLRINAEIMETADTYLAAAIDFDAAAEDVSVGSSSSLPVPAFKRFIPVLKPRLLMQSPDSETPEHFIIGVGDEICYSSELNSDITVTARVLGLSLSDNYGAPLELSNGYHLPRVKRMKKLLDGRMGKLHDYRWRDSASDEGTSTDERPSKRLRSEENVILAAVGLPSVCTPVPNCSDHV